MRNEVKAMCRVLGPPCWFCTISPKEKEWACQLVASVRAKALAEDPARTEAEVVAIVERELQRLDALVERELGGLAEADTHGLETGVTCLERELKKYLTDDLYTATRHFYRRVVFFKKFLQADASPIGPVTDIAMRIEFQVPSSCQSV